MLLPVRDAKVDIEGKTKGHQDQTGGRFDRRCRETIQDEPRGDEDEQRWDDRVSERAISTGCGRQLSAQHEQRRAYQSREQPNGKDNRSDELIELARKS